MLRLRILAVLCCVLLLALPAAAQKKPKDPVLQTYLEDTFADINAKLLRLADRLTAIEEQLARMKQQQDEAGSELRTTQTLMKTTDTSLSSFRLSTQQEFLSLRNELNGIRADLKSAAEATRQAPVITQPLAPAPPAVEGYITAVSEKDVIINLGSSVGIRVGTRLSVFRATDPKLQIGVVEVTEVLDANNSRARIVFSKPDLKFEFSDIVRPEP